MSLHERRQIDDLLTRLRMQRFLNDGQCFHGNLQPEVTAGQSYPILHGGKLAAPPVLNAKAGIIPRNAAMMPFWHTRVRHGSQIGILDNLCERPQSARILLNRHVMPCWQASCVLMKNKIAVARAMAPLLLYRNFI
jgi:hypothetical protein